MLRTRSFFGVLLVVGGALLLLDSLGLLPVDLAGVWWPLLILAVGLWLVLGGLRGRREPESESLTIPLEGASSARLRLRHGAGRLQIQSADEDSQLLHGEFVGGVDSRVRRSGDRLEVELSIRRDWWPDFVDWRGGFGWTLGLRPDVPLELELETGAGETSLELDDLQVRKLRIKTGASSTTARLPAHAGQTAVSVEAGVASVELHVPDGVAAQIRSRGGLTEVQVDQQRFPRSGDRYESPDFASAPNRVEIDIQAGVGSIKVS